MAEVAPWTRRQLLAAGAATLTTAACAGAGSTPGGDGATRPEPSPSPAPVDVPPDWGPGTLFTPQDVSGRALPTAKHAPTPPWFRAAPAFYCPSPRSGGSVLLTFTGGGRYSLPRRISHFRELPELLAEARSLGTDVLYLIDWYEGAEGESAESALWNKGDYVPRADLGGTKALKAGLAEVHALGGRALSYLELFVIAKSSNIGKKRGKAWSLVTREGREDNLYPKDWKLCPAAPGMDDYMIAAAKRIVGDLGFDGLHLDSYGYQRGWKCTADHGHDKGKPEVFDSTVLDLTRRIHTAIRAEKSDAVLMCEGPKIPGLFRYVSASQDWSVGDVQTRWLWNQQGVTNAFTSHWSLDDIHQIIALGHKLSLGGGFWHEAPPGPSPVAWLKRKLPDPIPDKRDRRFRRFYLEDFSRTVHSWRNAAILLGRPVPNIDDGAPRRWEQDPKFDSNDGMRSVFAALKRRAAEVEQAVDGAGDLPAPTAHIRTLTTARAAFQGSLEGSTPTLAVEQPGALGWRFDSPQGRALSAVNVSNTEQTVRIEVGKGAQFEELVAGDTITVAGGHAEIVVPPHAVRLCKPA